MKLSIEKKKELVSLYYNGIPVSEICQEYQISRSTFYTWIRTYRPIESQNSSRIVTPKDFDSLRRHCEKQEQIISKRVKWEEDFAKKFPALHDTARPIHTSQDTQWETSFETYARGEISTYSDKTVDLYLKMVEDMDSKGQNLSEITVLYMVKFYGYESLEKANERYEKEND